MTLIARKGKIALTLVGHAEFNVSEQAKRSLSFTWAAITLSVGLSGFPWRQGLSRGCAQVMYASGDPASGELARRRWRQGREKAVSTVPFLTPRFGGLSAPSVSRRLALRSGVRAGAPPAAEGRTALGAENRRVPRGPGNPRNCPPAARDRPRGTTEAD